MKKSMRELLERSFDGHEVIAYIEELEKNNTLLEREKKALTDDNEMKCDLNHDLQKQVDKLACKLAEIAEYAPCCVNVCPIGNPSNCNAECEESDKWKEWAKDNE